MNPRKKLKMSPQWSLVVSSCSCEEGRECFSPACSAVQKSYHDIMMRLEEEGEILPGTEERLAMIRSVSNSEIESVGAEERGENDNQDEVSPSGSDLLTCSSIYLPTERQGDPLKATQFGTQGLSGFDCCSSAAQGTFQSQQKNEMFNKSLLRSWMDPELARKCLLLAWWNVRRPHSAQEQLSEARTHGSYMDNEMNSCVRHPEHDAILKVFNMGHRLMLALNFSEYSLSLWESSGRIYYNSLNQHVLLDLFENEIEIKMKSIGGKYLTPVADVLHRMAYSTRIVGIDLQDIVKLATQCNTLEELQALLHESKLHVQTKHEHDNCSFVVEHACVNLGQKQTASALVPPICPRENRRRGAHFADTLDLCMFAPADSIPRLRAVDYFSDVVSKTPQICGHALSVERWLDTMQERCWAHVTVRRQMEVDMYYHVLVDFKILPKERLKIASQGISMLLFTGPSRFYKSLLMKERNFPVNLEEILKGACPSGPRRQGSNGCEATGESWWNDMSEGEILESMSISPRMRDPVQRNDFCLPFTSIQENHL
ncbi:hypothetical protein GUITHDRAFT_141856 [Guillardia theta CCMP2712]|uniref:Uncharacterized protein n=1 Tax=Guillardia theta (strain CCMP2712) TaxID=905079 RepID=L1IZS5_GUITC|nr:hypothetical protein GUITHDRAFT_141856 [Guillardia theta CCMP2712]EKX41597.1 hypothetical protein GUITHDRAFT_141856 [Guillardia theta CCMP2712]|eukprot:XP_005828577.1 hypothetical protein GUITHDRAFT_141856 [Guillardia theta CCMP2712]